MKNTNIKGSTVSTLGYTGIVTLSQYAGTRKTVLTRTHNEGGQALFNYLARCLQGDFSSVAVDRPAKIMLLNIDADGNKTKAINSGFIYITAEPQLVYSTTESIVKYSFIISPDMLIGTNFNAIGLYAASATESDLDNIAACCNVNFEQQDSLSLSSVLVVDWELHISNLL